MAMHNNGLTKVMEKCGELVQVCAKHAVYPLLDIHPDGKSMITGLHDEIADVFASCKFVISKFNLDQDRIAERVQQKLKLYHIWDNQQ